MKNGGRRIMAWGCTAAGEHGQKNHYRIDHEFYYVFEELEEHVRPSVKILKLNQNCTLQHDNDQKRTS